MEGNVSRFQPLGLIFEEFPGDPLWSSPRMARIYVETFTTSQHRGFKDPVLTLTPAEYDPDAFDVHADRLIDNIMRLKREARAKFEQARSDGNCSPA
jgi:hypothetical protein